MLDLLRKYRTFKIFACFDRERIRGVQKTVRSVEHHLIINPANPYSLTIKKAIPDIFMQNVFKYENITQNLTSVTSAL